MELNNEEKYYGKFNELPPTHSFIGKLAGYIFDTIIILSWIGLFVLMEQYHFSTIMKILAIAPVSIVAVLLLEFIWNRFLKT
jgi:hypothetical protein